MGNVRFEINYGAMGEILKSESMQALMNEYANRILGRLPEGYEVSDGKSDRAYATVRAVTFAAKKDNSANNTLLKAMGGS